MRGGARSRSGPVKKAKIARPDLYQQFIERLEKKLGKNWMDMWIEILKDKKFRSTNAGGKLVSQMFDFIFNEPSGNRTPWKPPIPKPPEGGEDQPLGGPPKLPPLKPDPAKATAMNNVTDDN